MSGYRAIAAATDLIRAFPERCDDFGGTPLFYEVGTEYLHRIVIQASHDGYLPAAHARQLFGADSTDARLVDIVARNHRFDGAEAELASALVEAVNWVASPSTSPVCIQ